MEWLTIGLLIFAGAQVWVQHRAEQVRLEERRRDAQAAGDQTYQTLWAEHFRLESLADQWEEADMLELAVLGVLTPDTVLPENQTAAAREFARLGLEAGYLGGVALTFASDLSRHMRTLEGVVENWRRQYPDHSLPELVQLIRKNRGSEIKKTEDSIRSGVRELSQVYWDAISHYEGAHEQKNLEFRDDLLSMIGRKATEALHNRSVEASDGDA